MNRPPNILTIAGSDSGGGAGIQADLKTIMALGCYGMSVISALTAQNGQGVMGIQAATPDFVALQMDAVLGGFAVAAAKTGMLFSAEIIATVARKLADRQFPLVLDPVSVSQSGSPLLQADAIKAMIDRLIPGCDLITPNIPEAEMLSGIKIANPGDAFAAAEKILALGAKAVLVKGGHMEAGITVTDYLLVPDYEPVSLVQARIDTNNNHGTGCTLSAAIASELGKGMPLDVAVRRAQAFLNAALRKSYTPGAGFGPVNHAARLNIF